MSQRQTQVHGQVAELAECFRREAARTRAHWRQVPLLCVLANGRGGWSETWSEAAATKRYPWGGASGAGLRIRCSDGAVLGWNSDDLAGDAYVLDAASNGGYSLDAWSGRQVASELALACTRPIGSVHYDAQYVGAWWRESIAESKVGLVADWEADTGVLGEVSENLVKLAGEWDGTMGSLLETSVKLAGAQGAPELAGMLVLGDIVI